MPFRILSIDGGGVRGVIPATVLAHLEASTGHPVHELFDLLVGTSSGGITVLALTAPRPDGGPPWRAAELVERYQADGQRIFDRPTWRRVVTLNGLLRTRYAGAGLEAVLAETLGEVRLRDLTAEVLIPAYDTEERRPWFFRRRRARQDPARDFLARDVARATAAAPAYFPAARVASADGRHRTLIDGAVFANNPAMSAIAEAMAEHHAGDLLTLSLGTGELTRRLGHERIRSWGRVQWLLPLLDVVFDGVSKTADFQAEQLSRYTAEVEGYLRLQVRLTVGNDDLDDASPANLAALRGLADELLETRGEELDRFGEVLARGVGAAD